MITINCSILKSPGTTYTCVLDPVSAEKLRKDPFFKGSLGVQAVSVCFDDKNHKLSDLRWEMIFRILLGLDNHHRVPADIRVMNMLTMHIIYRNNR